MHSKTYLDRSNPPVVLPELDKPQSEYRYQRKMFAFHKNMHSAGFIIGTDSVTQKYRDAVVAAYRGRDMLAHITPMRSSHSRSTSEVREDSAPPAVVEEMQLLRQQLKQKEAELEQIRAKRYSPEPVPERPRLSAKDLYDLSRSMERSNSSRPHAIERKKPQPTILRSLEFRGPHARNDSSLVFKLAQQPLFAFQRYTRQQPKAVGINPITGVHPYRSSSVMRMPNIPYA